MSEISNQRLFVLVGIPGAGKTTLATNMVESLGDNVLHINRDNVRSEVGDKVFSRRSESLVYKTYISRIATALKLGYDVIADATNLTKDKRDIYFAIKEILEKTGLANIDVVGIFISTPLSVCLERNSGRDDHSKVPDNIIELMHSKIEEPSYEEGFRLILNKN